VEIIRPGLPLPGDADLVIILGSKSTISDLAHFRAQDWHVDLAGHVRRGGHVLGLCGGYQMLGRSIDDPKGIEGPSSKVEGLGLLEVETVMTPNKAVRPVTGHQISDGAHVSGYEIHIGETNGPARNNPWFMIEDRPEGACSENGRVCGSYLHGIFVEDAFRKSYLHRFSPGLEVQAYTTEIETILDDLGRHIETALDLDALLRIAK